MRSLNNAVDKTPPNEIPTRPDPIEKTPTKDMSSRKSNPPIKEPNKDHPSNPYKKPEKREF